MGVTIVLASCASRLPQPAPTLPPPVVTRQPVPAPVPSATVHAPAQAPMPLPRNDGRPEFHTVQKGETLASLGVQYGVDYKDIAQWNQIDNPNQLKIGQVLRVAPPGDVIAMPIKPNAAAPEARALGGDGMKTDPAKPGSAVAASPAQSDTLKSAPKAIKVPYSNDALALVQNPGLENGPAVVLAKPSAAAPEAAPATPSDDVADWAWPAQGKIKSFYSDANKGLDIAGALGQPVMASAAGKVIYVGSSVPRMGKLIVISHSKNYLSIYAHNDKIMVKEGQQVSKGQKVAEMGNSDTDQVKLHFEIRHMGKPVDPMKFLPGDKLS
jgi:lipoprotein NlpD